MLSYSNVLSSSSSIRDLTSLNESSAQRLRRQIRSEGICALWFLYIQRCVSDILTVNWSHIHLTTSKNTVSLDAVLQRMGEFCVVASSRAERVFPCWCDSVSSPHLSPCQRLLYRPGSKMHRPSQELVLWRKQSSDWNTPCCVLRANLQSCFSLKTRPRFKLWWSVSPPALKPARCEL